MQNRNFPKIANMATVLTCLLAVTTFLAGTVRALAQTPAVQPFARGSLARGTSGLLVGHTAPQVLDGTAMRTTHYNPDQKLRLVLAIKPPHMAEEEKFLQDLQTKGSPTFHQFLTPEEWNARFAPSAEDEQAVLDWAKSQGLTVTKRYNHRLIVDLEGTAGAIEKAFHVTINNYKVGNDVAFANDRDPFLPASLGGIVYSVQGLNNIQRDRGSRPDSEEIPRPDYVSGPVVAEGGGAHADADPSKKLQSNHDENSGPVSNVTGGYIDPTDLYSTQIYNYGGLQKLDHCCNPHNDSGGTPNVSNIAIAGFGQFLPSDLAGFASTYGLAYDYNYYYIDGTPFCGSTCATGETTEDVEYSLATSNSFGSYLQTAHLYVYLGGNGNNSTYTDIYSDMLSDNTARIMTTSWSCTEVYGCSTSTMDARHSIFNSMMGQGWTLIAASGDRGATDDCNPAHIAVAYPGSDPDVVAAGGTSLQVYYPPLEFDYEHGWQGGQSTGSCGGNNGGSGGGISSYYTRPSWQSYQSGLGSHRITPDISLNALGVGQNLYINGGLNGDANGTSVVAPELSGFFARENSYLNYIGSICGPGTHACTPVGNPLPYIYNDGNIGAPHDPFYDITSGCNSNDVTTAGSLPYYCAGIGYDQVTGWGSANMMQLGWGINWWLIPAVGTPSISFSGPATSTWYNTDQIVGWTVADSGSSGYPAPGVAGFTQGWDSIEGDSSSQPQPGSSDSFYDGPEYPFATGGCLAFNGDGGCAGDPGQGCHTALVRAWDNQGRTALSTYGPVCYDTVAPTITESSNPSTSYFTWVNKSVQVTLTPTDPGGSAASGIYKTYYGINTLSCVPSNLGGCNVYGGPLTLSGQQQSYIYYFTEDNAGNFSGETYAWISIDLTAPVSTIGLSGSVSGSVYDSAVTVTLSATDTGGSGVATTYYTLDGGSAVNYSATPFSVSALGSHTVTYWSVDGAGNIETAKTKTFSIASLTTTGLVASPSLSFVGESVLMTATVNASLSGTPTGSVIFYNGATNLGTGTLSGGVATLTTTALPAGALTLQAAFTGSSNFLASNSFPFDQTVAPTQYLNQSATSLAFGDEIIGTTSFSQTVTLTNPFSVAMHISSIAVSGPNASSFGFSNTCGTSLAAGASCTVHGHFAPAAVGAMSATITITDSGSPQTITVTGTGVLPAATLSAHSLAFGGVLLGNTSASQSVTLTNNGTVAMSISSITLSGADATSFVFGNTCGTSLAAAASCTIHGHFTPTIAGALTATITITDTALNSPQIISLTGTGETAPVVSLSATSITFATQKVGTTSASQSVTLTNTGGSSLLITSMAVTGPNATSFGFANSCGTSLAAGASCTIHGHFSPTATGPLTATVTLTDNAAGSPQSIALSGTGD